MINVLVKDAQILTHNNDMHNSAYIKTWVGDLVPQSSYESAGLPRGGGWYVALLIPPSLLSMIYGCGAD